MSWDFHEIVQVKSLRGEEIPLGMNAILKPCQFRLVNVAGKAPALRTREIVWGALLQMDAQNMHSAYSSGTLSTVYIVNQRYRNHVKP